MGLDTCVEVSDPQALKRISFRDSTARVKLVPFPARYEPKNICKTSSCAASNEQQILPSVPQGLPGFQCVLDSLLRLALSAQRFEGLALEIEDVLLAHRSARSDVASAEHLGDLACELDLVIGDEISLAHEVR